MTLMSTLLFIGTIFGLLLVVAAGAAGSSLPTATAGGLPADATRHGLPELL